MDTYVYSNKLYIAFKHYSCAVCIVPFPKSSCLHYIFGFLQYIVGEGAKGDFLDFISQPNCKDKDTKKIGKIPKRHINWSTLGVNSFKLIAFDQHECCPVNQTFFLYFSVTILAIIILE